MREVCRYERGREDTYSSPYTSLLTPHRHMDPCVCSLCIHVYFILFSYFFTTQVLDLHMEEMILDGSLQRIWYGVSLADTKHLL